MGGYTIWRTLAIQGPACRCRQLCFLLVWIASNCLTELILLVSLMLDLSPSVRRVKILANPCGWHWLLINGLLYLVLSFSWFTGCFCCQLRSCSKRRPWRMVPLPQMQWLEYYFTFPWFSSTRCIGYLIWTSCLKASTIIKRYICWPQLFYAVGYGWWVERCGAMNGRWSSFFLDQSSMWDQGFFRSSFSIVCIIELLQSPNYILLKYIALVLSDQVIHFISLDFWTLNVKCKPTDSFSLLFNHSLVNIQPGQSGDLTSSDCVPWENIVTHCDLRWELSQEPLMKPRCQS